MKKHEELAELLQAANTDLAFALAQGDRYAEDDAAARVKAIEAQIAALGALGADAA